jgi:hypothetical protein
MTLRDTELIGKKLVKYGFHRSKNNHYQYSYLTSEINVGLEFEHYHGTVWVANFTHDINLHIRVKYTEHSDIFTPEWIFEEHKKLRAMFKFLRS